MRTRTGVKVCKRYSDLRANSHNVRWFHITEISLFGKSIFRGLFYRYPLKSTSGKGCTLVHNYALILLTKQDAMGGKIGPQLLFLICWVDEPLIIAPIYRVWTAMMNDPTVFSLLVRTESSALSLNLTKYAKRYKCKFLHTASVEIYTHCKLCTIEFI